MQKAQTIWPPHRDTLPPPWTGPFMETSLRALKYLHQRYLVYSISQEEGKQPDFSKLNRGLGLVLADELTVCAAISQEFLASPYRRNVFIGGLSPQIKEGERTWTIELQPKYSNDIDRADFLVERIDPESNCRLSGTKSTLIEAKRAYVMPAKLKSNIGTVKKESQIPEIQKDVSKLRQGCMPDHRGYILVWHQSVSTEDSLVNYFRKLNVRSQISYFGK